MGSQRVGHDCATEQLTEMKIKNDKSIHTHTHTHTHIYNEFT